MVSFPPLAPSSAWWNKYLVAIRAEKPGKEALEFANSFLSSGKEFGRYVIDDTKGSPLILSVAVEGGGRQLRDISRIPDLRLSEHGEWRKNHLRAIEACLGKKPFFRFFEEELSRIYLNREIISLKEFNTAIFRMFSSFLMENIKDTDLRRYFENGPVVERGREIAKGIRPEESVVQALMEYGKETLLGILAL